MKRVLTVILCIALVATALILPAPSAKADTKAYVIGGWLRLRAAPSFDSATLGSYNTGTAVTVLGVMGSWYNVRTPNNVVGYMYSAYLTFNQTVSPSGGTGTATVYAANGRSVNLRNGPGLSYGVIGTYSVGVTATILSRGASWHYIKVGKQTGYMMAKYLKEGGVSPLPPTPPTPSSQYTAYVYAANGKPVNLRQGPSKGYRSIGAIPVGTPVTVLQHNATWDSISVGGQTGYMMNKYLRLNAPTPPTPSGKVTLTGVTLYYANPVVGQVLAPSLTPAGATAQFNWYNNAGKFLAQGATYTVQGSDVGYSLMVAATGTGNTQGAAQSAYTGVVTTGQPVITQLTSLSVSPVSPRAGDMLTAQLQPAGATASYTWYRSDSMVVSTGPSYTVQTADAGYRFYCVAQGTGTCTGTVYSNYTNPVTAEQPAQALSGSVTLPNATVPNIVLTPSLNLNTTQVSYNWKQNGVTVGTGATLYITDAMVGDDLQLTVSAVNGSGFTGSVSSNYCIVQSGVSAPEAPVIYEIP